MPTTFLSLPGEIRIMIYRHLFDGARVRFHPQMHRSDPGRLSKRYFELLAHIVNIIFTNKQLMAEARPIFLRVARVNVTSAIVVRVTPRRQFLDTQVYPLLAHIRFDHGCLGWDKPDLDEVIESMPNLQSLALDLMNERRLEVLPQDQPEFYACGITAEKMDTVERECDRAFGVHRDTLKICKSRGIVLTTTLRASLHTIGVWHVAEPPKFPTPCEWISNKMIHIKVPCD